MQNLGRKVGISLLTIIGGLVFYVLFGNSITWALVATILYFEWRVIPKLNMLINPIHVKKSYAPYIREAIRK